jgi:hypothetical protein
MIVAAAFLAAAAPAPATVKARVAGLYQSQQMEVGAALELRKNGHFRYQLAYGAIDEEASGEWTTDGKTVRLTSNPMPNEPTFDLVTDKPAPKCTLSLSVDWGRFSWSSPPDVLVTYDSDPKTLHFLETDEQGTVHLENCAVASVFPIVPMFQIPGEPLKLSPATGHRLSLKFRPNDLGRAAFHAEPLQIDGSALVMQRYDAEIRFIRSRP